MWGGVGAGPSSGSCPSPTCRWATLNQTKPPCASRLHAHPRTLRPPGLPQLVTKAQEFLCPSLNPEGPSWGRATQPSLTPAPEGLLEPPVPDRALGSGASAGQAPGQRCQLYLDLEDQLVAADAELRLEEDGELLLGHRLGAAPIRALDALQGLREAGESVRGGWGQGAGAVPAARLSPCS